jgi:N-acetyl-gamma-glutamyl-phosphate reductase
MAHRVYIDGHAGTTGLRIREWLAGRDDLSLATLDEAKRKDPGARHEQIDAADVAVLCLPDDAAREAADWARESGTRVLDTSTAHRVAESWVYGLPELAPGQRQAIAGAARVSNPGCYPTGFILATRPLVDTGLLDPKTPLAFHALSGYTGGGRPMIEKWENPAAGLNALAFEGPYALDRVHKHVPEMIRYSGLQTEPQFLPAVGPFRCGMRVQIPLHADCLEAGSQGKPIWEALEARYRDEPFVHIHPLAEPGASDEHTFDPTACNDTNRIELHVVPHPVGHVLLVAVLDNLGKGAAGVAIQSLNLMLGCPETTGLRG